MVLLLGCIGDDQPDSSDRANTLVKNGLSSVQLIGVPDAQTPVPLEETAKPFLILNDRETRFLSNEQIIALEDRFPN